MDTGSLTDRDGGSDSSIGWCERFVAHHPFLAVFFLPRKRYDIYGRNQRLLAALSGLSMVLMASRTIFFDDTSYADTGGSTSSPDDADADCVSFFIWCFNFNYKITGWVWLDQTVCAKTVHYVIEVLTGKKFYSRLHLKQAAGKREAVAQNDTKLNCKNACCCKDGPLVSVAVRDKECGGCGCKGGILDAYTFWWTIVVIMFMVQVIMESGCQPCLHGANGGCIEGTRLFNSEFQLIPNFSAALCPKMVAAGHFVLTNYIAIEQIETVIVTVSGLGDRWLNGDNLFC